ncbi:MAG TPA: hypothetical protein VND88_14565 [Candidatus Acidoferrales bacterium]|nr:hypothetical protein [Candidatus Acidoferrales bacterium]
MFTVMGPGSDRSHGSRARLVTRAVFSLTALALAACGAASVPASVAGHPTAAPTAAATGESTHARAEAELTTLLASVRVPPGAEQVSTSPIPILADAPATEGSVNLLMRTAWWRVDMSFAHALAWVEAHPPAGLTSEASGMTGGPGVPTNRSLGFQAPSTIAYDGALLEVELAAMGSSATGMRVDAEVIWLPPKPADEFVPGGTAVTLVSINHFGTTDATTVRTRHLDAPDAAVVVRDLNTLLPTDGSVRHCTADEGYRIQIEVTVSGTPMVFSDWWACFQVQVTRGSTKLLTLTSTMSFQDEITHLIGGPPAP